MKISDVLQRKGSQVATVKADATIGQVLDDLAQHDVGALVVVDGAGIVGIISERDIVRHLQREGPQLLSVAAAEIMTRTVTTVASNESINTVMRTMTDKHVRHVPVVDNRTLVGIVSIGDVVKSRIDELETTADQLESYISGG